MRRPSRSSERRGGAHSLHTRHTKRLGASTFEVTMRLDPRSAVAAAAAGPAERDRAKCALLLEEAAVRMGGAMFTHCAFDP